MSHEVFSRLDFDTAALLSEMVHLKIKFNQEDKKEKIDMTQATISFKEYFLQEGRKEGRKEGRRQGLRQGRAQGLEEGRKKGREEGREEGQRHGVIFFLKKQGKNLAEIKDSLMETFSLTEQQAHQDIDVFLASHRP